MTVAWYGLPPNSDVNTAFSVGSVMRLIPSTRLIPDTRADAANVMSCCFQVPEIHSFLVAAWSAGDSSFLQVANTRQQQANPNKKSRCLIITICFNWVYS